MAVAINSPQSQKEVVGAIVMMYMMKAYRKVTAAKILFFISISLSYCLVLILPYINYFP